MNSKKEFYVPLPSIFVPVGRRIEVGSHTYRCVEADRSVLPCDACRGCSFARNRRNCNKMQCSSFDRKDGRFVWFEEV